MLDKIKFDKFTTFEKLEVKFSPGLNIFIGENGTGKTHKRFLSIRKTDWAIS